MSTSFQSEQLNLAEIPARIMNFSSRMMLSKLLNPEQPLPASSGVARDYRGLAELMDFDYMEIRCFQAKSDPVINILESWEKRADSTIGSLLAKLEEMERYDVIDDLKPLLEADAKSNLRRKAISEAPLQVEEVSSCRAVNYIQPDNPDELTIGDLVGGQTFYDAYVCYSECDEDFVKMLASMLERPETRIKLFIKGRDLLLGTNEYEAYVRLIEHRCNRMIIILSPEFLNSPECDFQTKFAAGLAIEQRKRKLIPLLYKNCEIPSLLKFVSKVDFTKREISDWIWPKLVKSIKDPYNSTFVTQVAQESLPSSRSQPVITFPPTVNHPLPEIEPQTMLALEAAATDQTITTECLAVATTSSQQTKPPNTQRHKSIFQNIKNRFGSGSSNSSASSGFHSYASSNVSSPESSPSTREKFV